MVRVPAADVDTPLRYQRPAHNAGPRRVAVSGASVSAAAPHEPLRRPTGTGHRPPPAAPRTRHRRHSDQPTRSEHPPVHHPPSIEHAFDAVHTPARPSWPASALSCTPHALTPTFAPAGRGQRWMPPIGLTRHAARPHGRDVRDCELPAAPGDAPPRRQAPGRLHHRRPHSSRERRAAHLDHRRPRLDAAPVVDQDPGNHWSKYRPDRITRLTAAAAAVEVTAGG